MPGSTLDLQQPRPSWADTWMSIAREISRRSYDPRLRVGAIIVSSDNTQMLSGGYNGNYAGGPHEHESPEPGQSGFIHAEVNALVKLDYNFPKPKHMYITHSPCRMCAKLIINAGVSKVVYGTAYRDASGIELLNSAGVETGLYGPPPIALELDEGDRQAVLMALAHLSAERPGWDHMLNVIAVRIDNAVNGRGKMYDEFHRLRLEELAHRKQGISEGEKT